MWVAVTFPHVQPFENNFGVKSNVLPVVLAHVASHYARTPGTPRSLLCFFCSFSASYFGYGLLRERHGSPVRGDVVVARFPHCRNDTWQRDLKGDVALRTASVGWHRPLIRIVLLRLRLVLVPGINKEQSGLTQRTPEKSPSEPQRTTENLSVKESRIWKLTN